jgi:hypothetical protein
MGPPAVVAELVLEVAPDALDEVELGRIGRKSQGADEVVVGDPPAAECVAGVVADVVEDHDHLSVGKRGRQLIQKAHEGGAVLGCTGAPHRAAGGIGEATERRKLLSSPAAGTLKTQPRQARTRCGAVWNQRATASTDSPCASTNTACARRRTRGSGSHFARRRTSSARSSNGADASMPVPSANAPVQDVCHSAQALQLDRALALTQQDKIVIAQTYPMRPVWKSVSLRLATISWSKAPTPTSTSR